MKYCVNCGAQLEDDAKFCVSCGAKVEEQNVNSGEYNCAENYEGQTARDKVFDAFENTEDTTADFDPYDVEHNKLLALLSYLNILFIVPLVAAPDSKFARFHANQGLVLFLFSLITKVVFAVPVVGWIVGAVFEVIIVIGLISGIINVLKGKAKELPVIGKYRIIK